MRWRWEIRLAGRTYDQIAAEIGVSKSTCSLWLRSLPGPQQALFEVPVDQEATVVSEPQLPSATDRRPDSAARRRGEARHLRTEGLLLKEIADRLGVSVKTAHLYTAGLPVPARARRGGSLEHVRAMNERRWAPHRRQRDIAALQRKLDAARQVGQLDDHTLLLLGAMAYWCEGGKSKPWRPRPKFDFINSDPVIMRIVVRWLRLLDVPPERWAVRIQIHESADLYAAESYWRHVLGVDDLVFGKAILKRHNPLTRRGNTGSNYHGCASIYVRRGAHLVEQVEGWMVGALLGVGGELPTRPMPWHAGTVAG